MMKVSTGLVAVMMVVAVSAVYGADASLSLDVESAYVFPSTTFNDGLNLQPSMKDSGFDLR